MEVEGKVEALAVQPSERGIDPRLAVNEEATLLLVSRGARFPCRIVELGLTGCRMLMGDPFLAEIEVRVEAAFNLGGIAFRFSGVTEWTDGRNAVGIRFLDLTSRRRDELVKLLCEATSENAAEAVKKAAEDRVAEEPTKQAASAFSAEERIDPKPAPPVGPSPPVAGRTESAQGRTAKQPASAQPAMQAPAKPAPRERRAQSRHEVDTSAVIYLVNIGCRLPGRILDLSLGGCRVRTDERFPVGIYTRVETEFRIDGLPFRLGGVIQALHDRDRRLVGVRFLDMSERKREQVEQLIEEIEEMRARGKPAEPGASRESA